MGCNPRSAHFWSTFAIQHRKQTVSAEQFCLILVASFRDLLGSEPGHRVMWIKALKQVASRHLCSSFVVQTGSVQSLQAVPISSDVLS